SSAPPSAVLCPYVGQPWITFPSRCSFEKLLVRAIRRAYSQRVRLRYGRIVRSSAPAAAIAARKRVVHLARRRRTVDGATRPGGRQEGWRALRRMALLVQAIVGESPISPVNRLETQPGTAGVSPATVSAW